VVNVWAPIQLKANYSRLSAERLDMDPLQEIAGLDYYLIECDVRQGVGAYVLHVKVARYSLLNDF